MLDNKTDDEIDLCESYKSQILNNSTEEKESAFGTVLKILTILLLLAFIVALSIYGYNYFTNKNSSELTDSDLPSSIQISDDDLKVIEEDTDEAEEVQKPLEAEKAEKKQVEVPNEPQKALPKEVVSKEVIPEKVTPQTITPPVNEQVKDVQPTNISTINESDIDKIANDMKIAIAQAEERDKSRVEKEKSITLKKEESLTEEESLKVPVPNSPEAKYLEDLADLSKEIEREKKNK